MFPLPRLKDGIGRQQLAVSLAMLAAVCLTGLFVVYQVSMALDSAVLLMIGAIGLGIVFAAGGVILLVRRLRDMGYRPFPWSLGYLGALFVAINLLDNRAIEAKFLAIPFLLALLAPIAIPGKTKGPPFGGPSE